MRWLALLVLAACGAPERRVASPPSPPPPPPVAQPMPAPTGARYVIPPAELRRFERATVVDGKLFASEGNAAYRLDGTHWTRVPGVLLHDPPPTVEVRDRDLVKLPSGPRYKLESYHPVPVRAAIGAEGHPLFVDVRGVVFAWILERTAIAHTNGPDGSRGHFQQRIGPGFESVAAVPPNIVGIVVHDGATTLVGRDGDVSIVRGKVAAAVVAIPRPPSLAVLSPAPGRTVAVTADGVRWAPQGTVAIDTRVRDFLAAAARSPRRPAAIAVGPDEVIVGHGTQLARITPARVTLVDLPRGEVVALARDARHGFVALSHFGDVAAPRGAGLVELGSLTSVAGPSVSHPIGAFTGADGRARFVDTDRAIACLTARGLEACGPVVALRRRIVHPLADGLVVEDQSIATHVVTATGSEKIEGPAHHERVYAGSSTRLHVLAGERVLVRRAGAWELAATAGDGAETLAIAADGAILVGMRGGAVLLSPAAGT